MYRVRRNIDLLRCFVKLNFRDILRASQKLGLVRQAGCSRLALKTQDINARSTIFLSNWGYPGGTGFSTGRRSFSHSAKFSPVNCTGISAQGSRLRQRFLGIVPPGAGKASLDIGGAPSSKERLHWKVNARFGQSFERAVAVKSAGTPRRGLQRRGKAGRGFSHSLRFLATDRTPLFQHVSL